MLTIDTETGLIKPGRLAPPLACVQFAIDDGPVIVGVYDVDPLHDLLEELINTSDLIVGQNIAYDLLVIGRQYPDLLPAIFAAYREERVTDTTVREKLRAIANGNMWQLRGFGWSLQTLAKRYAFPGGKDSKDPWRLKYMQLRGIPFWQWPEAAQKYAVKDVEATRWVYCCQALKAKLTEPGPVSPDELRQARAAWAMHLIGAAGVQTDPDAIEWFETSERAQFEKDKAILYRYGFLDMTTGKRKVKAARERMIVVMESLGDKPELTEKGAIKLDEEACEKSGDPLLMAYQRYGSRQNLLTRIQGLKFGIDQPLNPYFDSLMETGRTSCSKGRDGAPTRGYQIQNMRRVYGERECFCAAAGNVFIACDYDSFELCTLGEVCLKVVGYSHLADTIRKGLDPHLAFAANMLGWTYEVALEAYEDEKHPKHAEISEARQLSKIADFGYPGGMGAQSFRDYARGYGVQLTEEKAEQLLDGWHTAWPEMGGYFEWISALEWREGRRKDFVVRVTDINQLFSQRRRANITYTTACNSFFQGLAADAAKAAAFALVEACELGELQGWKVWNFVHDEFILEGPEADCDRAARVVQRIMVNEAQPWVPDVPINASPAAMYRWSKKAKPVYQDGKLVPWKAAA